MTNGCRNFADITTMIDLLRWRATHQPEQRAFTFLAEGEHEASNLTFAELERQAQSIGAALQARSMTGERVLLLYPPSLEYVTAFFGCLYAGAVAVPAYPPQRSLTLSRLEAIAADAQAQLIITSASTESTLGELSNPLSNLRALPRMLTPEETTNVEHNWRDPGVNPSDLAFLQYTSGSTGQPKGVMVSHGNLIHNLALMGHTLEGTPCDIEPSGYALDSTRHGDMVSWLPPYHDMGLIGGILMPMYAGRPTILMAPEAFLQRPFRWLQAISRYRATYSAAPNFAYDLCARRVTPEQLRSLDLSCWRRALCGAEPIRAHTLERFANTFGPCGFRPDALYPTYGLAEATLMASGAHDISEPRVKTVQSAALSQHQVVITETEDAGAQTLVGCGQTLLDQHIITVHPESLTICTPNQVGEIWVSGKSIAQGYWNRPEESEKIFRARVSNTDERPFLRTGDLGFLNDGHLFITGRLKDLIIIRGVNHYPQDIELTVEQSDPALRPNAGAAFSIESEGEEKLVVVHEVERPYSIDVNVIVETVRKAVAAKHGVQVYTVVLARPGAVPKTSSGKIQRSATRTAYLDRSLQLVGQWQSESPIEATHQLLDAPMPLQPTEPFEAWLILQLSSRLQVDARSLDRDTPIVQYGLDSVEALELMGEIEDRFQLKIDAENLFVDSLSISDISTYMRDRSKPRSRLQEPPFTADTSRSQPFNFSGDPPQNGKPIASQNGRHPKIRKHGPAEKMSGGKTHNFSDFINPYLGSLLSALDLDKRFTRGEGCYLYDPDGKRYLDFIAQYGALPFGFNDPDIWNAVMALHDAQEPSFVQPSLLEAAGELAKRLVAVSPAGLEYVTFANSGAEAVEAAIKMSRAATGRLGILATDNSFHGKTLGALSATGNPTYQSAFGAPLPEFVSIPFGDIGALEAALARAADYFAAFVVEPIQGEGGIIEAPLGYLSQAHALCQQTGTLLVVDEIQTGLGRTGTMFACDTEGVTPDIMTVAKALGGGLVPIGACLCTEGVYTEEFALKHSSTFAGNTLACRVGLATLDRLEADDQALIRQVNTLGSRLKSELQRLQAQYPDLIQEIRGRGYLLGLQFGVDRYTWDSSLLGYLAEQGFLTLLVSSYMLNVTGVRTAPTLNGGATLRIEPPLIATWEHCQLFLDALQSTLSALAKGNTAHFSSHLIGLERLDAEPEPSRTGRRQRSMFRQESEGRFAFLLHPLGDGSYADFDASFAQLSNEHIRRLKTRLLDHLDPLPIGETSIVSKTGQSAYGEFIVVPRHAEELIRMPHHQVVVEIEQAARLAQARGANIVGLGGFLSVVTQGGLALKNKALPPLTTGNSYTVVAAKEAIDLACKMAEKDLTASSLAVVGATGAIGRATSVLLSQDVSQLILIGNPTHPEQSMRRLLDVASDALRFLWKEHRDQSHVFRPGTLGEQLLSLNALRGTDVATPNFTQLAQVLHQRSNALILTTDVDRYLPQADVIVTATSSVDSLITPEHLKPGAILCDLSRPSNVSPEVAKMRSDVMMMEGGIVQAPGEPDFGFQFGLNPGLVYACMAETMILGLEHHHQDTSLGINLDISTLMNLQRLGEKHGFEVSHPTHQVVAR